MGVTFQATFNPTARKWPTRRLAQWAATNNINTVAEVDAWLLANVTTIAQARTVFRELIVAMYQMAADGETDGGG